MRIIESQTLRKRKSTITTSLTSGQPRSEHRSLSAISAEKLAEAAISRAHAVKSSLDTLTKHRIIDEPNDDLSLAFGEGLKGLELLSFRAGLQDTGLRRWHINS